MVATLPSDTHVVSDTGHTLAHNNLVDCLSAITGASPGGSVTAAQTIATLLPLTALGDILYESATPAPARLPGNTTTTKKFLTQTGTGTISAIPAWSTIAGSDLLEVQAYSGVFGDGNDGVYTLDGSTSFPGMTLAGSTYTMTRDVYATSFTINSAVTLKPHGFRLFCKGTVTINGFITDNGNNASGTNGGTAGSTTGSGAFSSGRAGATGVTGVGAVPGSIASSIGTGGAGGSGTSGAGGAGGGTIASMVTVVANARQPGAALIGNLIINATQTLFQIAGGSSGSGDGTNVGGGGGGGGAIICIFAWSVVNNGTISANGGAGGSPTVTSGGCGGGGGGSGGLILIYSLVAWTAGTTSVAAGAAGTGTGTGANGGAGTAGQVLNVVLS